MNLNYSMKINARRLYDVISNSIYIDWDWPWYILTLIMSLDKIIETRKPDQIVLLGAGYDARAYRMTTLDPKTVFFELDFKKILNKKSNLMKGMTTKQHQVFEDYQSYTDWVSASNDAINWHISLISRCNKSLQKSRSASRLSYYWQKSRRLVHGITGAWLWSREKEFICWGRLFQVSWLSSKWISVSVSDLTH